MDPKKQTFPKTLVVRRRKLKPGASQKRHLSSRKRFPTVPTYSQTTWQERTGTESMISGGEGHTLPGSACLCILLAFHLPINLMSGLWRWTWGDTGTSLFVSLTNVARLNTSACSVFQYCFVSSAAQLRTSWSQVDSTAGTQAPTLTTQ